MHAIVLAWLLTVISIVRADQVYYFTVAIWIKGPNGNYAVPAQCPAQHPIGCGSIGEPGYCCPAGNTCQWSNSKVACCPAGYSCSGWGSYQPTSWYATTTQWQPQSTTYVAPAGYAPTSTYVAPAGGYQQYCSTLYAHGPGLPTTAQGECGTILVENPDEQTAGAHKFALTYARLAVMVGALQILGGMLLVWR